MCANAFQAIQSMHAADEITEVFDRIVLMTCLVKDDELATWQDGIAIAAQTNYLFTVKCGASVGCSSGAVSLLTVGTVLSVHRPDLQHL